MCSTKAYRSDLKHFVEWCAAEGLSALPATPDTIANYIATLSDNGMKPATITRRLASIAKAHQAKNYDSPCAMRHAVVKAVLAGIRRTQGIAQKQKAKSWELRATMSMCRLWHKQGRQADARARLAAIFGWFTEGLATPDLQDAKKLLDTWA